MSSDTVEFEGALAIKDTPRALLVRLGDGTEHWVPKSAISDDSEVWQKNHSGTLVVAEWWATKEGLT